MLTTTTAKDDDYDNCKKMMIVDADLYIFACSHVAKVRDGDKMGPEVSGVDDTKSPEQVPYIQREREA